jgi:hypothetical protein
MRTGRAHPGRKSALWLLGVAAAAFVFTTAAGAESRQPGMREARTAARAAVLEHPTYRRIQSNARLVTRSCRRSRRAVHCSLYRWAPDPCALNGSEGPCAQVLTRRTWLVQVTRRRARTTARMLRIADTSASPAQSASEHSSS